MTRRIAISLGLAATLLCLMATPALAAPIWEAEVEPQPDAVEASRGDECGQVSSPFEDRVTACDADPEEENEEDEGDALEAGADGPDLEATPYQAPIGAEAAEPDEEPPDASGGNIERTSR